MDTDFVAADTSTEEKGDKKPAVKEEEEEEGDDDDEDDEDEDEEDEEDDMPKLCAFSSLSRTSFMLTPYAQPRHASCTCQATRRRPYQAPLSWVSPQHNTHPFPLRLLYFICDLLPNLVISPNYQPYRRVSTDKNKNILLLSTVLRLARGGSRRACVDASARASRPSCWRMWLRRAAGAGCQRRAPIGGRRSTINVRLASII